MAERSEKGETPLAEAKSHKPGFLKKAEHLSSKLKKEDHKGRGRHELSHARKGGK